MTRKTKTPAPPALDPDKIYSTADVARLAGLTTAEVSVTLSRHALGQIVGRSRVLTAPQVRQALDLLQARRVGNPQFGPGYTRPPKT